MLKTWIVLAGLLQTSIFGGTLFLEDFEKGLGKRWEPREFEGFTDYKVAKERGNSALVARANGVGSLLGTKVNIPLNAGTTFSWRWKIDHIPSGGSEDQKKTFDHTARLFVAFKTSIGPPRSINYVWGNQLAAGKTFFHPNSNRARFIVLESGNSKAGQWLQYSRDLKADWKLLFGDEAPPNIVGIGLMTDSDGTQTAVTGFYDDLKIESK